MKRRACFCTRTGICRLLPSFGKPQTSREWKPSHSQRRRQDRIEHLTLTQLSMYPPPRSVTSRCCLRRRTQAPAITTNTQIVRLTSWYCQTTIIDCKIFISRDLIRVLSDKRSLRQQLAYYAQNAQWETMLFFISVIDIFPPTVASLAA